MARGDVTRDRRDGVPRRPRRARAARSRPACPASTAASGDVRGRPARVRRARHAASRRATAPRSCASRPCCRATHLETSGYLSSFPHLAGIRVQLRRATSARHCELGGRAARHEDWSDAPDDDRRRRSSRPPATPSTRGSRTGHAARGRPARSTSAPTASATSRRTTRRACRSFRHARARAHRRRPTVVAEWHRGWLERGGGILAVGRARRRRRCLRTIRSSGVPGSMLAANQRDQGLKFELRVPDREREADGDHVDQLPPGSLRPRLRDPTARRRDRPHGLPRLRSRARSRSRSSARTASTRQRGRPTVRERLLWTKTR